MTQKRYNKFKNTLFLEYGEEVVLMVKYSQILRNKIL